MPSAKPKSPMRLTMKALIAAALARWPVVPEADQEIGAEPDALPAEEELHEIVRRHQHQHEEGEEAQIRHEARDRVVVRHVADGIDVDHARDDRHHRHHHRRQRVEAQRPIDLEIAGVDPGEEMDGDGRGRRPPPSTNRMTPSTAASDSAAQVTSCAPRSPIKRPKKPAMNAPRSGRKTAATVTAQPFIRWMSSTAMVPRLRK